MKEVQLPGKKAAKKETKTVRYSLITKILLGQNSRLPSTKPRKNRVRSAPVKLIEAINIMPDLTEVRSSRAAEQATYLCVIPVRQLMIPHTTIQAGKYNDGRPIRFMSVSTRHSTGLTAWVAHQYNLAIS